MMNIQTKEFRKPRSRDIFDFINIRQASCLDDNHVADLLVKSFTETYAQKLPQIVTPQQRISELRDIKSRRENGEVCVLELGYRIIGTFSLINPDSNLSECWIQNAANLRCLAIDPEFHGLGFSEVLLTESERIARSWSLSLICLHVQKGAEGVAKLYKKRGYIRDPHGDFQSHGLPVEAYFLPLSEIGMSLADQ
jgi:GNAT superfamily N-acetyltransferase